jgi:hypothetical protein
MSAQDGYQTRRLASLTIWHVAQWLYSLDAQREGEPFEIFNDEDTADAGGYRLIVQRIEPIIRRPRAQ